LANIDRISAKVEPLADYAIYCDDS